MKKALALTVLLTAAGARAQRAGDESLLVLYLGPPALVTVALDVVLLTTLVPNGTTGRGRAISTVAFAAVGTTLSVVTLIAGLTSSSTSAVWTGVSAASLTLELGSLVLGVYGIFHNEPSPDPLPEEPRPAREFITPTVPRDPPPQLRLYLPLTVHL